MPSDTPATTLCGCTRCVDERAAALPDIPSITRIRGSGFPGWRYACEICGNKRCPHHTNHQFGCTGSNEPGQVGSAFT